MTWKHLSSRTVLELLSCCLATKGNSLAANPYLHPLRLLLGASSSMVSIEYPAMKRERIGFQSKIHCHASLWFHAASVGNSARHTRSALFTLRSARSAY